MAADGVENTAQNEELQLASATDNQRNNIIENEGQKNDEIIGSGESNNGNRHVNNSAADEKATPKEVVSTTDNQLSEKKSTTPAPPRWRFVNEAKKSNGYASSFAGSYIKGQSSDELGAKYKPPDISLYKPEKEKVEPGKLKFYSEGKTDEEIYQVDVGCRIHDEVRVESEETAAVDDVYKGALFLNVNNNNNDEVDASTNETDVNQSANGTDNDDNQSTNELSNHIMAEQTTVMIKVDEGSRRKKYKRWMLYTLVMSLLLLVVILGVLLGKNNNDNGRSAASAVNVDGAVAVPPVVIVATVNETDLPSSSPSYLSMPTIQAPSTIKPSIIQAPTLPRQETPSVSPTTSVSLLPSQMTSHRPSNAPSFPPTDEEPTISPVVFIGACPQTFVPFLPYKNGDTVESNGIVYECIREKKCSTSESLYIKGWVVVGACKGSREPTLSPTTLAPTSAVSVC